MDSAGRVATVSDPANYFTYQTGTNGYGQPVYSPCPVSYTFDTLGRPSGITHPSYFNFTPCSYNWVQGVQYDFAGRLTVMQSLQPLYFSYVTEQRSYNVNGQLATLNGITYSYAAGQNNGQVSQVNDTLSGETITYQYDSLKRLTSASSSPTAGSSASAWTQSFQYDGFGNLTAKTLNGSTTQIPVDPNTNRLTYAYYDKNGNMTSGAGTSMNYDVANRVVGIGPNQWQLAETFQYSPSNKRIFRTNSSGQQLITFYGGQNERMGELWIYPPDSYHSNFYFLPRGMTLWFAGRAVEDIGPSTYWGGTIQNQTSPLVVDRVGTDREGGARFLPYGEEITSTAGDRVKFGTYTRDG